MRFVKEKRGKKKEKFVLKIESSNSVTIATSIAQSEEKGENGSIEREIMEMARKEGRNDPSFHRGAGERFRRRGIVSMRN